MIFSASSVPLNQNPGSLPNMQDALTDWFQPLYFTQIVKTVVNFQVVETPTITQFMGVRQPFSAQQLMMRPEGQREWRWEMIHCYPSLVLRPDDIITFNNVNYRVMHKWDYTEYGYIQYDIVQDYEGPLNAPGS